MRIIGYYNELGYRVALVDDNGQTVEDLYIAGNSPDDSSYTTTDLEEALSLDTIKDFCKTTSKEIAEEKGVEFVGTEYEDMPEL
jgi:hypothetical protein